MTIQNTFDFLLGLLNFLGSLAIFIFGMKMMSDGIQKFAAGGLKDVLAAATNNKFIGVFVGFIITALIQTSSGTTVMVVSFVNAGLLSVSQSIGVIMGANIGTTVTAWLIAVVGKVKITSLSLPLMAVGMPLMFAKKDILKNIGNVIFGFALLFFGLGAMKEAVPDMSADSPVFRAIADYGHSGYFSYFLFIMIGTVLTVVVQSSSASMGITLTLVAKGWIPFDLGVALVLGENIGTTITAYLASLIGNVNAKRSARAHLIFNVFGVTWVFLILPYFLEFIDYLNVSLLGKESVMIDSVSQETLTEAEFENHKASINIGLSLFHTVFNITNTFILIWFTKFIERIVTKMVKDKAESRPITGLLNSNYIFESADVALLNVEEGVGKFIDHIKEMLRCVEKMVDSSKKKRLSHGEKVREMNKLSSDYEKDIRDFLTKMVDSDTNAYTANRVVSLINIVSRLERISSSFVELEEVLNDSDKVNRSFVDSKFKHVKAMLELLDVSINEMSDVASRGGNNQESTNLNGLDLELSKIRDAVRKESIYKDKKISSSIKEDQVYSEIYSIIDHIGDIVFKIGKERPKA